MAKRGRTRSSYSTVFRNAMRFAGESDGIHVGDDLRVGDEFRLGLTDKCLVRTRRRPPRGTRWASSTLRGAVGTITDSVWHLAGRWHPRVRRMVLLKCQTSQSEWLRWRPISSAPFSWRSVGLT